MLSRNDILNWLREDRAERLETLWAKADAVRRESVGDHVHLRGLVEISNHCVRACGYCGLRKANASLMRYRMTPDEVVECARKALALGYGSVVLQSGEDPGITADAMAGAIRRIKVETNLAVTLSLGERSIEEFALWREAGADRYLLRFETSNRALYDRIHPPVNGARSDRFALLRELRALGYEIGSGVMVGIPGQTFDDLADDVLAFAELDLDMIGVGPFIAHPDTPLGRAGKGDSPPDSAKGTVPFSGQVPNTADMALKVIALARLVCPLSNIPATTALATLDPEQGRELGLMRGANVVMPNLTPLKYRALYEIYPGKACVSETAEACAGCLRRRIESIGRRIATGPGASRRYAERAAGVAQ